MKNDRNQAIGNILFLIGVVIFVVSLIVGYFVDAPIVIDCCMFVGLIFEFIGLCITYKVDRAEKKKTNKDDNDNLDKLEERIGSKKKEEFDIVLDEKEKKEEVKEVKQEVKSESKKEEKKTPSRTKNISNGTKKTTSKTTVGKKTNTTNKNKTNRSQTSKKTSTTKKTTTTKKNNGGTKKNSTTRSSTTKKSS